MRKVSIFLFLIQLNCHLIDYDGYVENSADLATANTQQTKKILKPKYIIYPALFVASAVMLKKNWHKYGWVSKSYFDRSISTLNHKLEISNIRSSKILHEVRVINQKISYLDNKIDANFEDLNINISEIKKDLKKVKTSNKSEFNKINQKLDNIQILIQDLEVPRKETKSLSLLSMFGRKQSS